MILFLWCLHGCLVQQRVWANVAAPLSHLNPTEGTKMSLAAEQQLTHVVS